MTGCRNVRHGAKLLCHAHLRAFGRCGLPDVETWLASGPGTRPGNGGSRRRSARSAATPAVAPGRASGAVGSATPTMWPGPLSTGRGKTWPASSRPPPRCRASGGARRPRATWRPRTRKPGCAGSITASGAMTGRLPGSGSPGGRPVSASQPTAGCSACGGYPSWCALSCCMPLAAGCRRRFAPGQATCAATSTGCARRRHLRTGLRPALPRR